jgi:hypothetical protein
LQNFIYFGAKGFKDYYKFKNSDATNKIMMNEMKRHGVFFTNLEEMAIPTEFLPSTKMVDGRLVETGTGATENFTRYIERVAKFSGKPMQWVENNVNRSLTFKIAFAKYYNELNARRDIAEKAIDKSKIEKDLSPADRARIIEQNITESIAKKAGNFAANMVKELHFEYSPFAKPKALRTPAGSVLGQFSTFSINFLEYQRKIASKGGNAILSRDWKSEDAKRLYRLGMTYLAIDALISPLFSTDIGSLVQNDTKERIGQLHTWFTGTEAERKKVFFGKGPLLGTFGGPFVSDLVTVGQLTNFMNMKNADWLSYLSGYQDFAERTKSQDTMEFVRMLNGQLARTMYSTLPKLRNGTGIMALAGSELGLYGSSNLKKQHNELFRTARKYTPRFMNNALTPLKEQQRVAKGYSDALGGKRSQIPDPKGRSSREMDEILAALSKLKQSEY